MARWKPDARGRLEQAALDLYSEQGFDQVTVAEIAARAGLTERTFYRYFADKREVLFWGQAALRDIFVSAIAEIADPVALLDTVAAALEAACPILELRREFAQRRHALIEAHPGLQERELMKISALAEAIADALHRKNIPDPAAEIAAETGIAIFKIAYKRWIEQGTKSGLQQLLRDSFDELKSMAAGE
jgi:AcrR family transcriptional regulator